MPIGSQKAGRTTEPAPDAPSATDPVSGPAPDPASDGARPGVAGEATGSPAVESSATDLSATDSSATEPSAIGSSATEPSATVSSATESSAVGDESPPAVVPAVAGPSAAPAPPAADPRRVRLLVGLAVAAVLLIAASVVLAVGAFTARSSGPLSNQAFVDSADTADVVGQVTNAVITVYSYDYTALPANEAAAKQVVTGRFATEFERVFGPVKQLAPQEQAVLKSTVPAAAVSLLQGDRARLLMMVDQAGTRGPDKQPTGATARLVVDAVKIGGQWKISEVTPE